MAAPSYNHTKFNIIKKRTLLSPQVGVPAHHQAPDGPGRTARCHRGRKWRWGGWGQGPGFDLWILWVWDRHTAGPGTPRHPADTVSLCAACADVDGCVSVCLCVCVSMCLCVCLCLSVFVSLSIVCVSVCLSVCQAQTYS